MLQKDNSSSLKLICLVKNCVLPNQLVYQNASFHTCRIQQASLCELEYESMFELLCVLEVRKVIKKKDLK